MPPQREDKTMKKFAKKDVDQIITDIFVKQLERVQREGISWNQGWIEHVAQAHRNVTSGHVYQGINTIITASACFENNWTCSEWGTYKTWEAAGYKIGGTGIKSQASIVQFIKGVREDDNGEKKGWASMKLIPVWNGDQLKELGFVPTPQAKIPQNDIEATEQSEKLFNAYCTNANIKVKYEGNKAFYVPSKDFIQLPTRGQFKSGFSLDATRWHEATHSTGHTKRLDRIKSTRFGSREYAIEELCAETGAMFMCIETGVTAEPRADHAHYVASWLRGLKDDKTLVRKAIASAQKAKDFILETANAEVQAVA